MKKKNIKIGCTVNSCEFNDCDCNECTLNQIKISSEIKNVEEKSDTICDSYKSKNE